MSFKTEVKDNILILIFRDKNICQDYLIYIYEYDKDTDFKPNILDITFLQIYLKILIISLRKKHI